MLVPSAFFLFKKLFSVEKVTKLGDFMVLESRQGYCWPFTPLMPRNNVVLQPVPKLMEIPPQTRVYTVTPSSDAEFGTLI